MKQNNKNGNLSEISKLALLPKELKKELLSYVTENNIDEARKYAHISKEWQNIVVKDLELNPIITIYGLQKLQQYLDKCNAENINNNLIILNLSRRSPYENFEIELVNFIKHNFDNPKLIKLKLCSINLSGQCINNFLLHFFICYFNIKNLKYLKLTSTTFRKTTDLSKYIDFYSKNSLSFNSLNFVLSIIKLDAVDSILDIIKYSSALESLDIADTKLLPSDLIKLMINLELKKLDISGFNYDNSLYARLNINTKINEIVISSNINDLEFNFAIRKTFMKSTEKITIIKAENNNGVENNILKLLINMQIDNISKPHNIKHLVLKGFEEVNKETIQKFLSKCPQIKSVSLNDCAIGKKDEILLKKKFKNVQFDIKNIATKLQSEAKCVMM